MIPSFLEDDALTAAPQLLGWKLISRTSEGMTSGYIVEVEAYHMDDPASHSYRGLTPRTAPMFAAAGTIYVYFTYGMHFCLNLVTGPEGQGQAILIRALEPVDGINLMQQRRGTTSIHNLTNGPAKLTQAMGINRDLTGKRLNEASLSLASGLKQGHITQTTRIGISKAVDQPWRFYLTANPYVSKL